MWSGKRHPGESREPRKQVRIGALLCGNLLLTAIEPACEAFDCLRCTNHAEGDRPSASVRHVEWSGIHQPEADVDVSCSAGELELRLVEDVGLYSANNGSMPGPRSPV